MNWVLIAYLISFDPRGHHVFMTPVHFQTEALCEEAVGRMRKDVLERARSAMVAATVSDVPAAGQGGVLLSAVCARQK